MLLQNTNIIFLSFIEQKKKNTQKYNLVQKGTRGVIYKARSRRSPTG